jgi:hypothetical protein
MRTFLLALTVVGLVVCTGNGSQSDEPDFEQMIRTSSQCASVCDKLAKVCGRTSPGCQAACSGNLSADQRACLMRASSCSEARMCTESRTLARTKSDAPTSS